MDILEGLPPEEEKFLRLVFDDPERPCDAAVWLQGDRFDRGEQTLELYLNDFATMIVITGNNELVGPETRPDENNVSTDDMVAWLLRQGVSANHIFVDRDAKNTHEQAENTIRLALTYGLRSLALVASLHHMPRAFLTFLASARRHGWKGVLVNYPTGDPEDIPSGRSQPSLRYLPEEFMKIYLYQKSGHVAQIADGITVLENGGDCTLY